MKWGLIGLLSVIALLVLASAVLLGSEAGSRWLMARVPGLSVHGFEGRLATQWRAEELTWQQGERRVELVAPGFNWSPRCLLRLRLCVKELSADEVTLDFPPGEPTEDTGPLSLPTLRLPLAIQVTNARVGRLILNGEEQLRDLQLNAHWTEVGLRIDSLRVRRDEMSLVLQGQLDPQGNWPLTTSGTLKLPAPDGREWSLTLQAHGELQKNLQLIVNSTGYLQGRLEGDVQPLVESVPATLRLRAEGFKASAALPDTLTLNRLNLQAEGDLQAGYRINGSARLPAQAAPIELSLAGRVTAQGADIQALRLDAGEQQHVQLEGRLEWHEGFVADATLDWQAFPWLHLYPMDEPPVNLEQMHAQVHYRDGNYLGNFDARLQGPAGPFTVSSPVSGDLSQVHFPSLQVQAGQGRAEGQLSLGFADAITWKTALQLEQLDPSYWVAELPGQLGGLLRSEGRLQGQDLQLQANIELQGQLRGQSAALLLDANAAGPSWQLPRLDLRLGDNRIQGRGGLNGQLQGQVNLALGKLNQLWPGLRGSANGRLDLAGTREAPQARLDLQGQQLRLDEQRIASLVLKARLDQQQQAHLSLQAREIRSGDTEIGELTLTGQGNRQEQAVALRLEGEQIQAELNLAGQLEGDSEGGWNWQGQLSEALLAAAGQRWQLQQAAPIERRADGQVTLGAHCWRSGAASLCGEEQRLMPDPRIRYRLRDFPLNSLAAWLPDDFQWQGELDAEVALDLPASGPSGRILVDAGQGRLRLRDPEREQDQWVEFPYRQLRLDSQLKPEQVDVNLRFDGGQLGELTLQARIDPRQEIKPLSGDFSLRGLNLAVARPFVPQVARLEGQINGSGRLAGSLQAPLVEGEVRLTDGHMSGGELPMAIEDLQVQARIAGQQVSLDGNWRSGTQGQGRIGGSVAWQPTLQVDVRIQGSRLPVVIAPYAELEVAPDLRIAMTDEALSLSGKVDVPRGAITIRELPPSTVKLSSDAVIVGEEAPEQKAALPLRMDIDVVVGQEELSFSGFGLTAEVAGGIHIGDNLDTRGELSLNRGRYRAYGQRLTIRRARLLFVGPIDQPFLDVEAIRRVDDVIAGLRISGSAAAPRTQIFSEPAMSQEQALSYLVLGRPLGGGDDDTGDSALLAQAALGLGLAGSAGITGNIARQLGIKDFLLESEGSGGSTSVVASGRISDRLSLSYGVGVFEPVNTLALRYRLSRRVFLEAASGLASSLDIFYRRDF